ncbi:MAG: aspartate aminotransferase family protein [Acidimicrobiia bacterium]
MPETIAERESRVVMQTYRRHPVEFVRGEDVWLFDREGRRYLDFLSGIAVAGVGHANPRVQEAVAAQMGELVHVSNLFYTEPQVRLAERLSGLSGLDRVFFANDGATANECAIKLARRWSQRRKGYSAFEIISLEGSFHGRTLATLSATGQPAKQATFEPLPAGFRQVPPGDVDELRSATGPTTAAVMIETTQGEGGVLPLDAQYLQGVRELCDALDALLIVDDVQAGMGRTGTWFSWQSLGFEPDIATVAKGLANGLPIGACMARDDVASAFAYGDHATTFGGGPVVCGAALAVLEEIESRGLLENAVARSVQLRTGLSAIDGVEEVRGRGLLLAAVVDHPGAVVDAALQGGLVLNALHDAVRVTPPLTITVEQVDLAIERFRAAVYSTRTGSAAV